MIVVVIYNRNRSSADTSYKYLSRHGHHNAFRSFSLSKMHCFIHVISGFWLFLVCKVALTTPQPDFYVRSTHLHTSYRKLGLIYQFSVDESNPRTCSNKLNNLVLLRIIIIKRAECVCEFTLNRREAQQQQY